MMMSGFVVGQFLSDDKDNNAINGAQCSHGICYHVASLIYQVWGNEEGGEMIWVFFATLAMNVVKRICCEISAMERTVQE